MRDDLLGERLMVVYRYEWMNVNAPMDGFDSIPFWIIDAPAQLRGDKRAIRHQKAERLSYVTKRKDMSA
jgi:hypothetical protein